MQQRPVSQIRRDLRANLDAVALGQEMRDPAVIAHFEREAAAMERELDLRLSLVEA